ncbi:MAG TPA: diaminopimelate decarboxylase [Thermoanaerobaculia bacterium]|nr:diaminopimelate decarboxylase [Thermoanaerobaculia bacterium]
MNFEHGVLQIGNIPSVRLVEEFGSPLYVYDAAVIRRQIERIRSAFASLPLRPFYAAKANSNLAILGMIREAGFGCDAVSPGEVFLARRAGFPPDRIWFTCSNVSDDDLLALKDPSIVVNVNSMSEIDRVLRLDLTNPIALRVNPDVGAGHHRDVVTGGFGVKFGIDAAELDDARVVLEDAGRSIVGIHAHIGSGVSEPGPLLEAARKLIELAGAFTQLRWINFGGGMGVPYRPGDAEFPIAEYGAGLERIAGPLLRRRDLEAILEPGRYVVAESGVLLATVTAKRISSGFVWIGCDTGFNHLARPSRYGSYHHIVNASRGEDRWLRENMKVSPYDPGTGAIVAGNICESGDVFTREEEGLRPRRLPETHVGDLVALCDAGAYGFTMASHYNARMLPAEVMVDGSSARLIRARQKLDQLLADQKDLPDAVSLGVSPAPASSE